MVKVLDDASFTLEIRETMAVVRPGINRRVKTTALSTLQRSHNAKFLIAQLKRRLEASSLCELEVLCPCLCSLLRARNSRDSELWRAGKIQRAKLSRSYPSVFRLPRSDPEIQ